MVCLLAAFPSGAPAQDADPASITDLVRRLTHGPYEQRETAARQLIARGTEAIPLLQQAIRDHELELSHRAVTILREMCLSADDETWKAAQVALQQVSAGENRMAALFAQDVLQSQRASAEQRLVRLGCKHISGKTTLTLPSTWVGGQDGLINLRWLPHLRTIRIEGATLHPEALAHLKYTSQLQHLVIINVPVDDRVFDHIRQLPELQTLYLTGTRISDQGLASLKGREDLTWLEIQQTAVSDASLDVLESLEGLRGLQVTDTRISADGVTRLQRSLPQTNIFSSQDLEGR
jgi:hypothetical protein